MKVLPPELPEFTRATFAVKMEADNGESRMIADVLVPDTQLVRLALDYARTQYEPYLLNHAVRSWLFAAKLGQLQNIEHDAEVVAVAALLHSIKLSERFDGRRRFEIEGADLAQMFARDNGVNERRSQLIWDSVALHSTPSIGLYKETEIALCTAGICLDLIGFQNQIIPSDEIAKILADFPRLDMKRRMIRCFCHIAETRPETTYDNFIRDFGERYVFNYRARTPSSDDLMTYAFFDE